MREGEVAFREREAELVMRLLEEDTPKSVRLRWGHGDDGPCTAFGDRSRARRDADRIAGDVVARIRDLSARPNLNVGDPISRARELMSGRAAAYGRCHLTIATDEMGREAAVEAIARLVDRDPLAVALGTRSYCVDVCCDEPTRLRDAVAALEPSSMILVMD